MDESPEDAQAVLRAEESRLEAMLRSDVSALDRILADGYFYSNSSGDIVTKADLLEALGGGRTAYRSLDSSESLVRVYGQAAILTGRLRERGSFEGEDFDETFRITEVFARQAGREWRAVAYHLTRILS